MLKTNIHQGQRISNRKKPYKYYFQHQNFNLLKEFQIQAAHPNNLLNQSQPTIQQKEAFFCPNVAYFLHWLMISYDFLQDGLHSFS